MGSEMDDPEAVERRVLKPLVDAPARGYDRDAIVTYRLGGANHGPWNILWILGCGWCRAGQQEVSRELNSSMHAAVTSSPRESPPRRRWHYRRRERVLSPAGSPG